MEERKSRYELFLEEEARKAQPTKRCSKCKEIKALGEFAKRSDRPIGVQSQCKVCVRASQRIYKSREDRFWKYIHLHTKRAGECMEWTGNARYPSTKWNGKNTTPQRVVYQLSIGEVLDENFIITTCRNKKCVRQSHLRQVTAAEMDVIFRNSAPVGDRNGCRTQPERLARGEKNPAAKLTEDDVKAIRTMCADKNNRRKEIAHVYGVSQVLINRIARRAQWAHVE